MISGPTQLAHDGGRLLCPRRCRVDRPAPNARRPRRQRSHGRLGCVLKRSYTLRLPSCLQYLSGLRYCSSWCALSRQLAFQSFHRWSHHMRTPPPAAFLRPAIRLLRSCSRGTRLNSTVSEPRLILQSYRPPRPCSHSSFGTFLWACEPRSTRSLSSSIRFGLRLSGCSAM